MDKVEPQYVAKTLAWCNKQRKVKGKKPLKRMPKGRVGDPESCPCGKATGLFVGNYNFWPDSETACTWVGEFLPRPVQAFVNAFDNHRLPQYKVK